VIAAAIIALTSMGQILLKLGANSSGRLMFNRHIILGYGCFVCVIFLSAILMRAIEFKYFSVIISLNYLVTTILAFIILKERVTTGKVAGCMLITGGAMVFSI
jgi:drug/metabolite transporter (DMT)-like permease